MNLSIVRRSDTCDIDLWEKNDIVLGSIFRQMFVYCAPTILYGIYSTVGRSIASISDLGSIYIYLGSDISAIDLLTVHIV